MRNKWDFREILQKNAVTVMFVVLCLIGRFRTDFVNPIDVFLLLLSH